MDRAPSPAYMAVSLPSSFRFQRTRRHRLLKAVLPCCRERGLPLSLMIGVRYKVNPRLRLAGDGVGRADLSALEYLCRNYPENRFLASALSRENQHELSACSPGNSTISCSSAAGGS